MKVLIFLFVFLYSLFSYANIFDGSYFLSNTDDCTKILSIDIKNNYFAIYSIDTRKKNRKLVTEGQVKIVEDGTNIYLKMGSIEGIYDTNTIVIQNYGNSMNYYSYFNFCGSKYLYFEQILE